MKSEQLCFYLILMELDFNDYGDDFMIMIMKKTSYDAVYDQPYISVPKTSEFQSGPKVVKKGSKHPMLSLSMAYNVISCKKKSKETLKNSKSLILQCKFGSRAQK